jgi:hypothetical protein
MFKFNQMGTFHRYTHYQCPFHMYRLTRQYISLAVISHKCFSAVYLDSPEIYLQIKVITILRYTAQLFALGASQSGY